MLYKLSTIELPLFQISFWVQKSKTFTHCILVDSSTDICRTSPFVILGVPGIICRFYSNFKGKSY